MAAQLTDLEQRLLGRLRAGGSEPVPRKALLRDVWNLESVTSTRTVDMAISRLRRKLTTGTIASVQGHGYLLRGEEDAPPDDRIHLLDGWLEPTTGRFQRGDAAAMLSGRQRDLVRLLGERVGMPVARARVIEELGLTPRAARSSLPGLVFRLRRKLEVDPASPNHLITLDGGALVLVPAEGTHASARHNLPERSTAWIGRAGELEQLAAWLQEPGVVVLTGPPGVGKSRLADEAARRLIDGRKAPSGGIWYCDARSATQEGDLWEELGAALGVSRKGALPDLVRETLDALGDAVLAVDNVEQLPRALDPLWTELAAAAPRLRLLLTSRRTLAGARELRVAPLAGDDARALLADRLSGAAALSERAQDDLIRRVDGLPLALEGLAAQLGSTGGRGIDRVDALRLPAGEITLRDVLARSFDALPARAKRGLESLSLLEGSFDGATARGVLGERWVDVLGTLEGDCLVERRDARWPEPDETWRVLQVVRELGRRELHAGGRQDEARAAVQAALLARGEEAARGLTARRPRCWLERLKRMRADLRAAARHLRSSKPADAARFEMVRVPLLKHAGTPPQVLAAATRAHELARASGDPALLAEAAALRGRAWYEGQPGDPHAWIDEGLSLAESLEDDRLAALLHQSKVSRLLLATRLEDATAAADRWLAVTERPDARFLRPMASVFLAILERKRPTRPWADVQALLERSVVEAREAGDTRGELWATELLAIHHCNNLDDERLSRVLDACEQRDLLPFQQRFLLQMRAALERQRGDYERAKMLFGIVLSSQQGGTFDRQMERVLINLAFLHLLLGEGAAAERALDQVSDKTPWSQTTDAQLDVARGAVEAELGRYDASRDILEGLLRHPELGRGIFAFVAAVYLPAVRALGGDLVGAAQALTLIEGFDPATRLAWADEGVAIGRVFAGLDPRPAEPLAWLRSLPGGEAASRSEDLLVLLRWMDRLPA